MHSENGQKREQGFEAAAARESRAHIVEKINCSSQSETVQAETRSLLLRHPEINAIVTFNELTTLGVGHAIEELGLQDTVRVVGFDNNVVSVGMLETGEIDVLIVQNPFAMGYLGLEAAFRLINGQQPDADHIDTEVRAIGREDMYTEQNQKFLFSFTQNQ
ncbi:substrate-binding domain-containing protein [Intestinibacillus sp. NTUH-41-i26]|uniref:substrate-binding domain-containing protein n=1 Tax=Intestinibacillus sp. NTUH-41-i26 TaxID=3079303 RepID=UPI002934C28E|nr:substrate-binding domain-containing protein [Intestinibacillus sp. NTUH-41-i26]WOC76939.1 substrate-binding domain-containing protein [Intestinibacillus sp. NTUH-41-i26]